MSKTETFSSTSVTIQSQIKRTLDKRLSKRKRSRKLLSTSPKSTARLSRRSLMSVNFATLISWREIIKAMKKVKRTKHAKMRTGKGIGTSVSTYSTYMMLVSLKSMICHGCWAILEKAIIVFRNFNSTNSPSWTIKNRTVQTSNRHLYSKRLQKEIQGKNLKTVKELKLTSIK